MILLNFKYKNTYFSERTNYNVESFNNIINNKISIKHPKISVFVDKLKDLISQNYQDHLIYSSNNNNNEKKK